MKKIIALVMGIAFAFGTAGFAAAQTPAPAPKAADKVEKAEQKGNTMLEQKTACLDKAGTDEAKKAACEKKFAKKGAAMKKEGAALKKEGAAMKKEGDVVKKEGETMEKKGAAVEKK
jgi:hypothetical protein